MGAQIKKGFLYGIYTVQVTSLRGVNQLKKYLTRASAMYLINKGTTVVGDLTDGKLEVLKKPNGLYEIRLYVNGESKPEVYRNTFAKFLKTMNNYPDLRFYELEI